MFRKTNYYLNNLDDFKRQVDYCKNELDNVLVKLAEKEKFEKYFAGFINLYSNFLSTKPLIWENIQAISSERMKHYERLPGFSPGSLSEDILKRLVVVKLNGGLGTTMGCSYPKSLITVRDGMNFLDITLVQLNQLNSKFNADVPLILMNSFSTNTETLRTLHKYSNCQTKIHTFIQSQYPRISGDTLLPTCTDETISDNTCWYPPGHGNFYESLYESGLMKKFINEGRDIAFVSNIDNLGATVDLKILKMMTEENCKEGSVEFMMEVVDKTKADVKGGTLIEYDGKVRLLEIAQVPKDHVEDFKNISNFEVFNTNNIWMNLVEIYKKMSKATIELDVIKNQKILSNGASVIQLETAIGAAVKNFKGSIGLNVPRSRFLPVKNNSDLLLVMSNLYIISNGNLVMNTKRFFKTTPIIQLSGPYFKTVKDFLNRFSTIPDILELDYLAVSGDVNFDKDVSLKGTVIVLAQHGDHIDIPRGSVLENKIISGNLRIVDH